MLDCRAGNFKGFDLPTLRELQRGNARCRSFLRFRSRTTAEKVLVRNSAISGSHSGCGCFNSSCRRISWPSVNTFPSDELKNFNGGLRTSDGASIKLLIDTRGHRQRAGVVVQASRICCRVDNRGSCRISQRTRRPRRISSAGDGARRPGSAAQGASMLLRPECAVQCPSFDLSYLEGGFDGFESPLEVDSLD